MKEGAAELLGIHPNTLRKRMDKLRIHCLMLFLTPSNKAIVFLKL
jgi:sugar diacid utilization regulator